MGSGADIIEKGWKENGWPKPELKEIFGAQTESVELTLRLGGSPVFSPEHDGKLGKSGTTALTKASITNPEVNIA